MTRSIRNPWIGALLVVGLVSAAGPAGADSSGWYVELRHGRSSLVQTFGSGGVGTTLLDDESNTSSAELGYSLNPYFGLQAGYQDLGTFRGLHLGSPCPPEAEICPAYIVARPLEAEVTGWSLAAVPAWPWNDRFALYGKLGALAWEGDLSDLEALPVGVRTAESFSDTDLLTAVGARYRFARGFGVLLEHQRLDLDLDSTTLGVSWKF